MKRMATKTRFGLISATLACFCSLFSCNNVAERWINVVLEEGDYRCINPVNKGHPGEDFTFEIVLDVHQGITGCDYVNYTLMDDVSGSTSLRRQIITFHSVRYSCVIHLDVGDVQKVTYQDGDKSYSAYIGENHLRFNLSNDFDLFDNPGYKLCGWTDEEGNVYSLGSRAERGDGAELAFRPYWAKESPASDFLFEVDDGHRAKITGYLGEETDIVIPERLEGRVVSSIEPKSFQGLTLDSLVLPKSLSSLKKAAITDSNIQKLVIFDGIDDIGDDSFEDSVISHVQIHAVEEPAYSRGYFATYADKVDRLVSLQDKKKIVLYGGSATRFGFVSDLLDAQMKDYEVVNMGVYAYTESLPQVDVIRPYLKAGDILIVSPEFDTLETQFNVDDSMDFAFFAMCEANYAILDSIEVNQYPNFFDSFQDYLSRKRSLPRYSYHVTPSSFNEDGNPVKSASYNPYGDYCLYRPNNIAGKSFGVRRAYYNKIYFPQENIDLFNHAYEDIAKSGVNVLFDYAPRMKNSISEDSNETTINELAAYLEDAIQMSFISSVWDSLLDPLYFFGTDNHLSSEGARRRTEFVISRLKNLNF